MVVGRRALPSCWLPGTALPSGASPSHPMKRSCSSSMHPRSTGWLRVMMQAAVAMNVALLFGPSRTSPPEQRLVAVGLSFESYRCSFPSAPRSSHGMRRVRKSFGRHQGPRQPSSSLHSSFFGDFEKFDNEDDEDDEEEEEEEEEDDVEPTLDGASLAAFRSKMDFLFDDTDPSSSGPSEVDELINYARSQQGGGTDPQKKKEEETTWARLASSIEEGVVLIANPAKFCADLGAVTPSPTLLSKFGLTMPPPPELGADRRADLLPVLIIVEAATRKSDGDSATTASASSSSSSSNNKRTRGVLLNRRTGYLLGDLEQPGSRFDSSDDYDDDEGSSGGGGSAASAAPKPLLEKFCIQPLWFGGVDNVSSGLDMLHQCPAVIGCRRLTNDGLYWGGDPSQAQTAMEEVTDRVMTGFDFKFFVQSTLWPPGELERQIDGEVWFLATVSKEVLFKPRDRMGTRRAKPLWTECMELLGGKYKEIRDSLYAVDT